MTHDWGAHGGGPCLWCGANKLAENETAECLKHPRSAGSPRPFPGSYLDDLDGLRKRLDELRAEREATFIATSPE